MMNSFYNKLLDNLMMKTFLNVISFYLFSMLLLCIAVKAMTLYPIMLYLLMFLLLVGMLMDGSVKGVSLWMFSMFLVLHVVFLGYGYWETEMFWMKELFWYSLVLLGCFVWHVLMLEWLYSMVNKLKWDYGRYVVSSVSLVTSLMGVMWMMQWLMLMLEYKCYFEYLKNDKLKMYAFTYTWSNVMLVFLYMLLKMLQYFTMMFTNYSNMMMGNGKTMSFWEIPMKYYMYMMLTFSMGYMLGMPSMYMMWVMMMLYHMSKIMMGLYQDKCFMEESGHVLDSPLSWISGYIMSESLKKYGFAYDWNLLYSKGLYKDYILYSELSYWTPTVADFNFVMDMYHPWVDVFNYSEDRTLKMFASMVYHDWVDQEFEWNEEMSKMEMSDLFYWTTSLSDYNMKPNILLPYMKNVEKDLMSDDLSHDDAEWSKYKTLKEVILNKKYKYI